MNASRSHAQELGARAEEAVASYLQAHGFVIVERNLRLGKLELDIVARDNDTIAIVEVRTRSESAWTSGFGSIDNAKRARIRRAGERLWQRRYRRDESIKRLRFDAASVSFSADQVCVDYVRAAF